MGLFEVLSEKFKLQHNEKVLSLQYCKLGSQQRKNGREWTGYLRIEGNECRYIKKIDN